MKVEIPFSVVSTAIKCYLGEVWKVPVDSVGIFHPPGDLTFVVDLTTEDELLKRLKPLGVKPHDPTEPTKEELAEVDPDNLRSQESPGGEPE